MLHYVKFASVNRSCACMGGGGGGGGGAGHVRIWGRGPPSKSAHEYNLLPVPNERCMVHPLLLLRLSAQ